MSTRKEKARKTIQASAAALKKWEELAGSTATSDDDPKTTVQPPRVFLLDDDALFCKLMEKIPRRNGVPLKAFTSLDALRNEAPGGEYDVAIIDYYLDDARGPQVATWLMKKRPVVLVSRSEDCVREDAEWPECIKKFVAKKEGPVAILEEAMRLGRPTPPPPPSRPGERHLRLV